MRHKTWRLIVFLVFSALLLTGCSKKESDRGHDNEATIPYFEQCLSFDFEIDSLPYERLPNINYNLERLADTSAVRDDDGIILFERGGEFYYHPIGMCHNALNLVAAFRGTQDSSHLELAAKYVQRLIGESDEYDGALYYPYQFDYKVHNMKTALLEAPWYSGMAQGEILGLLCRMFWATGDSVYIGYADRTFRSFLRFRGEAEPWTVFVDSQGCYWVEEYPLPEPSMTLNGFIFAIYGLYDYYLTTGSEESKQVLTDCLSTIKNYVPLFRRPGKPSFYGLTLRHWAQYYHMVHIRQLRQLDKMTGDPFFRDWADSLASDFNRQVSE